MPALNPDVAVIHAQYVGEDGTVRIKVLKFCDIEIAKSAKHVIVTCKEIVPTSFIREDPDQNCLPNFLIDAIVKVLMAHIPLIILDFMTMIQNF